MTIALSADTSAEVEHWGILENSYLDTEGSEQENQDADSRS
jgi:hypothetical protein